MLKVSSGTIERNCGLRTLAAAIQLEPYKDRNLG